MHGCLNVIKTWWPSLLVLSVILWLTLAPRPIGDAHIAMFEGADKIVHAIMMGTLTSALLYDYYRSHKGNKNCLTGKLLMKTCVAVAIFSIVDEWAQSSMHMGRSGDIADLIADIIGIVLAALITPPLLKRIIR